MNRQMECEVLTAAFAFIKLAYLFGKEMKWSFYYYIYNIEKQETTEGSKMIFLSNGGLHE